MEIKNFIYNIDSISLYIHWPYCKKKCPYCDFNSYEAHTIDNHKWIKGYINELQKHTSFIHNLTIKSIFFGGGTPSLMPLDAIHAIIDLVYSHNRKLNYTKDIEITLETNPSSFEIEKFKELKAIGINRISIGVQSFNDKKLKFLGRNHNSNEAIHAIRYANDIFDNVSFDLIFALPNQTMEDIKQELEIASQYFNKHISIYQLTIEPNTAFFHQNIQPAPEQESIEMYTYTKDYLNQKGLMQYEVSNFAKDGWQSYHNLNYWNGGLYLGIGPGAHGRLLKDNIALEQVQTKMPNNWLDKAISSTSNSQIKPISTYDKLVELILMSLRINKPIKPVILKHISPVAVKYLLENNFLSNIDNNIEVTQQGQLMLNYIIYQLIENIINIPQHTLD